MSFPLVRSSISLTEKESQSQINPRVPYTEWSRQSKSRREISIVCFVNLVDFDALWGHRRDVKGYAQELEKFDVKLGELLGELEEADTFAIIGATIADNFGVKMPEGTIGHSILDKLN